MELASRGVELASGGVVGMLDANLLLSNPLQMTEKHLRLTMAV